MINPSPIAKLPTFIEGLDHITQGGLPMGRTTLVTGTAGSSKTVFAAQFLAEGVRQADEHGVFVTFEESPNDIRRNMADFGWDIQSWENQGKWAFVDASPTMDNPPTEVGAYDLSPLLARIEYAIKRVGAKRLSIDSLWSIFSQFSDNSSVRRELFRISMALKKLGITSIVTAERSSDYAEGGRFGVEEFVVDNVLILRNAMEEEKRRRTLEILKFRGTNHLKGEFPFSILPGEGMVVIPLSAIMLNQESSNTRITTGCEKLDTMCGGGVFRDSIVLISGPTGTGKTLLATQFMSGGVKQGERCLLFAYEESRQQLFRNATSWGVDFKSMEDTGLLLVVSEYPESSGIEDHLIRIKRIIKEYKPDRVAIDSLSALERISTFRGSREFIIGLTSFIKRQEIAGLFTSTTSHLFGGESITDAHISTITDAIILLRYVDMYGEMRRGLNVLKMRGSKHDKDIREFIINSDGIKMGKAFREVTGIMAGNPRQAGRDELEHIRKLYKED